MALVLNAALLAVLLPWLRRQWREASTRSWRAVLLLGLGLRVLLGVARSWTPKLDADFMSGLARDVTVQLWNSPGKAWQTLTQAVTVIPIYDKPGGAHMYDTAYQGLSNTWFMIKLLAFLNLGSLETPGVNGLYLSLFAFAGCWVLVRKLAVLFPATPAGAGVVAFLLWPSAWFWGTGISKEAVLLGSGAWLTARVLGWLFGPPAQLKTGLQRTGWWLGTVALAFLHFKMRYFFALPLAGVLAGLAFGRLVEIGVGRKLPRWAQAVVLVGVLGGGVWVASQVSVAFRVNKFTNQVIRVYTFEVQHSAGKPHFEYPELRPTVESIAAHAPLAAANVLTRPWLGESRQPLYVAAGLENALLMSLLAVAFVAVARGRAGHLPFGVGLALAVFCLLLAVMMGLTTPNLGSLSRYRSGMLPFLVLLLLQHEYAAQWLGRVGLGSGLKDPETQKPPPF